MNYHLHKKGEDIWIQYVEKMPDTWNCRQGSVKEYIYRIAWNSNSALYIMEGDLVWHVKGNLNMYDMQKACEILQGTHDYSGFTQSTGEVY